MPRTQIVATAVLRRRHHAHPRTGACLVEFAATLPGGVWTDRPLDVQPILAAVARRVNDRTSDDARIALLPWAAWLVGTNGNHDEDRDTAIAARTGAAALRHADPATATRLAAGLARVAWPTPTGHGRLHTWRRKVSHRRNTLRLIRLAITTLAATPHPDETLRALLADTVNLTRGHQGLEPVVVDYSGYQTWPRMQPVTVEVRTPDGTESTHYFCTALPQQWPPALAQAWSTRTGELRRIPSAHHAGRPARPPTARTGLWTHDATRPPGPWWNPEPAPPRGAT